MYDIRERNARRRVIHSHRKKGRYFWVIIALIIVLAIQLFYPKDVTTPFTRLDGKNVPGLLDGDIATMIQPYDNAKIRLEIKGKIKTTTVEATTKQAGLVPDVSRTRKVLLQYPVWQRLLPLSVIVKGIITDNGVKFRIDQSMQKIYISEVMAKCVVAPKNAGLKIQNDRVVLDESRDGQVCNAEKISDMLKELEIHESGVDIATSAHVVEPTRNNRQLKTVIAEANKFIKHDVTLRVAGKKFSLEKSDLLKFVIVKEDVKNKNKLALGVSDDAVKTYLSEIEENIYKAPSLATTSKNGDGLALDYGETTKRLRAQMLEGDGEVEGKTVPIPAGMKVDTLFAPTNAGLQLLLDDIVASKANYGISVRFLDNTVINSHGDKSYHPASTYKMYVAYALLKRIERGEISWSQSSANGTISHCFDLMILHSDNTCAEWFGSTIGWNKISSEIRALGLANTSTAYGGQRSTANDETLFLVKLQNGKLLRSTERDRLLSVMKRQVYRDGIPAGVNVTVADKVGFLNDDLHDAAIVYSPKLTYALTIMTTGSSWFQIADAASQIQLQINRM